MMHQSLINSQTVANFRKYRYHIMGSCRERVMIVQLTVEVKMSCLVLEFRAPTYGLVNLFWFCN